jgi:integrase
MTAPGVLGLRMGSLTEAAGLSGLRFHDLRHTFITMMVERGVPLGVIQSMVGHISARMLRHYTHVSSGAARKAVEALDRDPILAQVCGEIEEERRQPTAIHCELPET